MTIRPRRQINISKQTTLLNGVDVGPPKQCYVGMFNSSVHEAMNNISNVKVHLKTCSRNVNVITLFILVDYPIQIDPTRIGCKQGFQCTPATLCSSLNLIKTIIGPNKQGIKIRFLAPNYFMHIFYLSVTYSQSIERIHSKRFHKVCNFIYME